MKSINRREFLGGMGCGVAGSFGGGLVSSHSGGNQISNIMRLAHTNREIKSSVDVKINLKPVFTAMVHAGVWEGPCRHVPNKPYDEEIAYYETRYKNWRNDLAAISRKDINVLEPAYMLYNEREDIGEKELRLLAEDDKETDVYFMGGSGNIQYPAGMIGLKYKKPVIYIGELMNSDMAACLRNRGLEGYAPKDYNDFYKLVPLLRARKVFSQTNLLVITNREGKIGRPVMSNVWDFEDLRNRFGINTKIVTYGELEDELSTLRDSDNEEIKDFTYNIIKNARGIHIDEKYIRYNVEFTFAVKNLMKKYNCNAHTTECFEFCSAQMADKWQVVPCFTHSVLKDEGYPSACEGDICALLAMVLLTGISRKSAYMGNMYYNYSDRAEFGEDYVLHGHNVPTRKIRGYDTPDLPYELRNFVQSGWGTKFEIDLGTTEEKKITMARFNGLANKMAAAVGDIVEYRGLGPIGCTQHAVVKVPGAEKFAEKRADYGFHFASVLGDYSEELKAMGRLLTIETELYGV